MMLYFNYEYLKYNIMRNEILHQLGKTNVLGTICNKFFLNSYAAIVGVVLMFSISNGFSQESKEKLAILEKNVFLKSLNNDFSKSTSAYNHVIGLLQNVNESIYLTNNQIKTYGQNPICMFTDVPSIPLVSTPGLLVNNIELVTINISNPSDIKMPIDLSSICILKNLKYIHIKLNFDIESEKLIKFIKNCNPRCIIFYSVQKIS